MQQNEFLRAGIVASSILNCFRKKGGRIIRPHEFIPGYKPKVQTVEAQIKLAEMLNVLFGGNDLRSKKNDAD